LTKGVNFINILLQLFFQYPFTKNSQSQDVIREKLQGALLYEKRAHKNLMKLTTAEFKMAFTESVLQQNKLGEKSEFIKNMNHCKSCWHNLTETNFTK